MFPSRDLCYMSYPYSSELIRTKTCTITSCTSDRHTVRAWNLAHFPVYFSAPLPRTRLVRSVVILTTRACWLASTPPTGEYERKPWQRTTTTTTIQSQTPAPRGRTPTARAAPSPDSPNSAGLKARPRTKEQRDLFLFCLQWRNKITEENANAYS